MRKCIKKLFCLVLSLVMVFSIYSFSYAENTLAGQEKRTQVLYLADIIEDDLGMDDLITRRDFARMVAKASPYKDSVTDEASSSVFNDVGMMDKNASYIKLVTNNNYMSTYLGGFFKPDDGVSYKELIRSCLALLGYTNEDFEGDQTNGRYQKFCQLEMNEFIDKGQKELMTKKDCINAIYNMLKCNQKSGSTYCKTVFNMSLDSSGEPNASGLLKTKMQGPFLLKQNQQLTDIIPFDPESANIFINGAAAKANQILRGVSENGYMLIYYNKATRTIYAYAEGTTPDSTTKVMVGYVYAIYYNGTDMLTPTSVDIDRVRYKLGNTDMKLAFSYAGTLHVDDKVVIVVEKDNEALMADEDSTGDVGVSYGGTIVNAFLYQLIY
ncbi:MAG: hypothetical protein MJ151_02090 [Lachnospiraceae bacterium]|nr:hypothetical protein [Lachnospiraceae bacterium]